MGLLSNKIQRDQLKLGDHIYTWRNGYSYSHHGIYVGDGKVIHLTRAPGLIIFSSSNESSPVHRPSRVVCCSTEEFLCGGDLNLYHYGVNRALFLIKRGGTCTHSSSDPPKDVLHRASILREKGFGDYNLINSNCEDFAIYCKTGLLQVDKSMPGTSGQIKFLQTIFVALMITPYHFLSTSFIFLALVVCGFYCFFIFAWDRGFEKVAVEKFDLYCHRSVRMEKNGSTRRSPLGVEFISYTLLALSYWSCAPTNIILIWIRSVVLFCIPYSFVSDQLRNHPMNLKLGEYVACIIWVLGYWYWSSESRIYFWTKFCLNIILMLFITEHPRRMELLKYASGTTVVLGFWYWTPKITFLLWIRLVFFYASLFSLFNLIPKRLIFDGRRLIIDRRHLIISLKIRLLFFACVAIHSAVLFLGVDYRDYFFSIIKSIFL